MWHKNAGRLMRPLYSIAEINVSFGPPSTNSLKIFRTADQIPCISRSLLPTVCLSTIKQKPLENPATLVSSDGRQLSVNLQSGPELRFHSVWLRHNCHCEQCRASAGQRQLSILDFPKDATITEAKTDGDKVELTWVEDPSHTSILPVEFLRDHSYNNDILKERYLNSRPITFSEPGIPTISYKEIKATKEGILRWLGYISDYGMSVVTDIPTEPGMIAKVAEFIAPVQSTSYGRTFQVVSEPEPINIAYSLSKLNLHMDLLNYESAPGLQLLHALSFDECVTGGDSRLLDIFHVAEQFRISHPKEFYNLTRIPATFQRIHFERETPVCMTFQRPHILLNHREEIAAVFWTQQNEGPLCVNEEDVEPYFDAYRKFADAVTKSDMVKSVKLKAGDAIVFNNRRVLHGRLHFDLNGGRRHLEGCYVNIDEFKSRYRCLSHELGVDSHVSRVGNQCWF